MKNLIRTPIALLIILVALGTTVEAQVKVGLRLGLHSPDVDPGDFNFFDDINGLGLKLEDAKYGYHIGIFFQIRMGGFYIQPEFLYNTSRADYSLSDVTPGGTVSDLVEDEYTDLDIPITLGWKIGFLRIGGGPVGHIHLDSTSSLFDIDGYEEDFKSVRLGWQAGVGLDLWKLVIDLKYEGNFTKYGDHITIGGEPIEFAVDDNRMLLSVGLAF